MDDVHPDVQHDIEEERNAEAGGADGGCIANMAVAGMHVIEGFAKNYWDDPSNSLNTQNAFFVKNAHFCQKCTKY